MFDLSLQGLIGDICHSLYLQLLILQKLLVYCCDFQLITSRRFETSFWLKGGRAFRKCIPSNHPITYQRYKKGNRHTTRSIRYIPHDYWSNRTTHYRHDKQRRGKLGLCTRIPQCQREDSRKHDALSQIQGEERNER